MSKRIIIHDTVHGSITLDPCASKLIGTPEIRRLGGIRQLGLSNIVFPGANHTRLEHVVGTYHIAQKVTHALGLEKEEADMVSYAALLHDLGHGPYSHTLEAVLYENADMDHMDLTKDVIRGKARMVSDSDCQIIPGHPTIPEILKEFGQDPEKIADLVCGKEETKENGLYEHNGQGFFNEKIYLYHLIHGSIDCDQIDYLLRDSHYTGVGHGTIDLARLLQTLTIHNNDLVVQEKGLSAVEGMLVARSLMYSSVYFHKTCRIAELMLVKAVEKALDKESAMTIQKMDDAELMGWLYSLGGLQREMVQRLKYRVLYKAAFGKRVVELSEEEQARLMEIAKNKEWPKIEKAIIQRLGLKEGSIIIDLPEPDILLSEPRIGRADIKVLSGDRLKSLSKLTPFSKAIQQKKISRWAVVVACDKKNREEVGRTAEKIIFD